jgi:uncharacterized protein YajQ (UPF0234 family)
MADASFDIVSKVDKQEVSNALTQSQKEISQRYDFKNVGASIEWSGENILIKANSQERVLAVLDVFQTKLIKRNVSLKALDLGDKDPQLSGKEYRLEASLKDGISQEDAKKISKMIREEFGKTEAAHPGRRAKGLQQVQGRPAGRHGHAAQRRPGSCCPVHQLSLRIAANHPGTRPLPGRCWLQLCPWQPRAP